MRLYLDDYRKQPEGWERAFTAKQAKEILHDGLVKYASLDHDLEGTHHWYDENGEFVEYESGHDVVKFMVEHDIWPEEGLRIHTDNVVGRENMMSLIDEYGPYTSKVLGQGRGSSETHTFSEGMTVLYT